jgi:XTP/dITP diphosphohydrolase
MSRRFREGRLVIASHNPGKVREITALLKPFRTATLAATDLSLPEPEETGATFIANAELKARSAATLSGLPALADDSGLAVDALEGAPGIYSARWAGARRDFADAMARVWEELRKSGFTADANPPARFVAALSLCWPDGECVSVTGTVEGTLVWPPRGTLGFGYDPIFVPAGESKTFGEMAPEEKTPLTHRARAFAKLIETCFA